MIADRKEPCGHDENGVGIQPPFGAYAAAHGIMAQVVTLDENSRKRNSLPDWQQLFDTETLGDPFLYQVLSPWMFQFVVDRMNKPGTGVMAPEPLQADILSYLLKQFRWQDHESSLSLQFATLDVERAMKKLRKAANRRARSRSPWSWPTFRRPMAVTNSAAK